jgi:hypothetical protein
MLRAVLDKDGAPVFDMTVGNTDINQGVPLKDFEAEEVALVYDGKSKHSDKAYYGFKGIYSVVKDRYVFGVTSGRND